MSLPDFIQDVFSNKAVIGKGNIIAEVIAHSVNIWGAELITFRVHYPRLVHQEELRHRVFSNNVSSSRAIPTEFILDLIGACPAMPVEWGKNQAGMQADGEHAELVSVTLPHCAGFLSLNPEDAWKEASKYATIFSKSFSDAGYHKQIANRLTEPFQFINQLVTATDWNNFFGLRLHKDADPTIKELARVMYEAKQKSNPELLRNGEWHTPYVQHDRVGTKLVYHIGGEEISLKQAKKISISAVAQASYRRLDLSLDKAEKIYDRLITSKPVHASPTEMVATPMSEGEWVERSSCRLLMYKAFPNRNFDQMLYERNFKGWLQERINISYETIRG